MNKLVFFLCLWIAGVGFVGSAAAQTEQQSPASLPSIGSDYRFYCVCGEVSAQNGKNVHSKDPKVTMANYHRCGKCNRFFLVEYFSYSYTPVRITEITNQAPNHHCDSLCIRKTIIDQQPGAPHTIYQLERTCGFQHPIDVFIMNKSTRALLKRFRLEGTTTKEPVRVKRGEDFFYYLQPVQETTTESSQPAARRNRPGSRQ